MELSRRKFLHLAASATGLPTFTRIAMAQAVEGPSMFGAKSVGLNIDLPHDQEEEDEEDG